MRTIAIKMKSYAEDIVTKGMEGALLNTLIFSLGALAIFYVLLLGSMVLNIIERKALEAQAHKLSNDVADLEQNYLALSSKVDLAFAHAEGFKEIKATFATRKTSNPLGSRNIKVTRNEI
ncbi:MAG TPA: hypothetical protein VJC14_03010 [Candidatus Paceibacterota bacterium]